MAQKEMAQEEKVNLRSRRNDISAKLCLYAFMAICLLQPFFLSKGDRRHPCALMEHISYFYPCFAGIVVGFFFYRESKNPTDANSPVEKDGKSAYLISVFIIALSFFAYIVSHPSEIYGQFPTILLLSIVVSGFAALLIYSMNNSIDEIQIFSGFFTFVIFIAFILFYEKIEISKAVDSRCAIKEEINSEVKAEVEAEVRKMFDKVHTQKQ